MLQTNVTSMPVQKQKNCRIFQQSSELVVEIFHIPKTLPEFNVKIALHLC